MKVWRLHLAGSPKDGVFRTIDVRRTKAKGHDPYEACKTASHGFHFTDEVLAPKFNALPYKDQTKLYFGFLTLKQYKAVWKYAENRRKLEGQWRRSKIVLVQYEVPDELVISSPYQCVFPIEEATPIQSRKPTWV